MKNYDVIQFDSITQFGAHVDYLHTNDIERPCGEASTRERELCDVTLDSAIKTALDGGQWAEGARNMPRVHVPYETLTGGAIDAPIISSDVVGFAPNVPAYITGTPDSMLCFDAVPETNKLLKVAVSVSTSHTCEQNEILNRGAAIMAILDQLSRDGYSIELWAVFTSKGKKSGTEYGASIEVKVKDSTSVFSPESIAYALAHEGYQRRLCFRTFESLEGENGAVELTMGGYGRVGDLDYSRYDIGFDAMDNNTRGQFMTIDKAVDYVKELAIEQLKQSHKQAA